MLVIKMLLNLSTFTFDVETAFLLGELQEEIYMECPQGMNAGPDDCLLLTKAAYGLCQSPKAWFTKWSTVAKKIGFYQSRADPCLFIKAALTRW